MFFLKELQHTINLHPSNFGPTLKEQLEKRLYAEVEGSCSGRFGYIISVVDVANVGKGKIFPGMGVAQYNITYRAIVFKPFKGEVVDAVITTVNKMGFFAEVGPLTIFVSTHLIPDSYKFDANSNPPSYIDVSYDQKLCKGSHVRIKIVGTRIDATQIFAIGTIKEDYLGLSPA
ncbi:RNA polymerase Rpb7 [Paraphysoderma sedebokerense]|nr:RNA polymerase Rpb7 [Paraphysoderma sedebokerense]